MRRNVYHACRGIVNFVKGGAEGVFLMDTLDLVF